MIDLFDMANRHFLNASGLSEHRDRPALAVRIIISDAWCQSAAGQLLASCLVNLLCRQPGTVKSIEIVATMGPSLIRLPNGEAAGEFPGCLQRIGAWATNALIPISTTETALVVDQTVVIGDVAQKPPIDVLSVVGTGWTAWVGHPDNAPREALPRTANPLGPFLAAALVAGEIFKKARGIVRGRMFDANGYSLWSGCSSESWTDLEEGPAVEGQSLPPLHLIGAGAVGNDVAYILANMNLLDAYVVGLDDDTYDGTNLNRCLLAGWQDLGHPKVNAIGRALTATGIGFFGFPGTVNEYIASGRIGLRSDVAQNVDNLIFEVVLSCVDRGVSRQHVQGLSPQLLIGASTLDLVARSNVYPDRQGAACLSCFNPAEKDGEKIRALEKRLREMSAKARYEFLLESGCDPAAVQAWLDSPQCGTVAEASVQTLATKEPPLFSVGFVSLGAALLGVSTLLRQMNPKAGSVDRGDMNVFSFLNGVGMDSFLAPDPHCEWGCEPRRSMHSLQSA